MHAISEATPQELSEKAGIPTRTADAVWAFYHPGGAEVDNGGQSGDNNTIPQSGAAGEAAQGEPI